MIAGKTYENKLIMGTAPLCNYVSSQHSPSISLKTSTPTISWSVHDHPDLATYMVMLNGS